LILATNWVTVSALSTAGATLVLAFATFASVRSANRAARAAERSLLAGLLPLLIPSRPEDPPQKVNFADDRWFEARGSGAIVEVAEEAIYLAMAVRNAGSGIAVLHGWYLYTEHRLAAPEHAPLEDFHRLTRDLYVPAGEVGFWQRAFRDPSSAQFAAARDAVVAGQPLSLEILYGDHEGGQRVISRFSLRPRGEGEGWIATTARHWNIDRDDPR
jgi:hypothetical protein